MNMPVGWADPGSGGVFLRTLARSRKGSGRMRLPMPPPPARRMVLPQSSGAPPFADEFCSSDALDANLLGTARLQFLELHLGASNDLFL